MEGYKGILDRIMQGDCLTRNGFAKRAREKYEWLTWESGPNHQDFATELQRKEIDRLIRSGEIVFNRGKAFLPVVTIEPCNKK